MKASLLPCYSLLIFHYSSILSPPTPPKSYQRLLFHYFPRYLHTYLYQPEGFTGEKFQHQAHHNYAVCYSSISYLTKQRHFSLLFLLYQGSTLTFFYCPRYVETGSGQANSNFQLSGWSSRKHKHNEFQLKYI